MKITTLILIIFVAMSNTSFGQRNQRTNITKGNEIHTLQVEEVVPVKLRLKGGESLCQTSDAIIKQFKRQGVELNNEQMDKVAAYAYNTANPGFVDNNPNAGEKKSLRIRIRIRFKKYVDDDGYTHIELDLCIGKNC